MTAKVSNEACDRCGTCIGVCPANALLLLTASLIVDNGRCNGCGRCAMVCPFGALELVRGPEDTKAER
jgi:4Fe-4S ferredoxin